ncbi:MAG: hypothetical protein KY442_12175 [Proteobacteria bacterium]|nr:hypothetical protein [Pseudomonadota bacterium]
MCDAMDYLEALGRDAAPEPAARHAGRLGRLAPAVRDALEAGDAVSLRNALGLPAVMACMISVPSEDEDGFEEQPVSPDEQPDESQLCAA